MTTDDIIRALIGFTKWAEVDVERVRDSPRDFAHAHVRGVLSGFGIETPVNLYGTAPSYGFYELPEVVQGLLREALIEDAKRSAIRDFLGLRQ